MEIYSIKNLNFSYNKNECVLEGINLDIEKGDFLLLMGSSGSGKTTLLRLLKSVLAPKGEKSGSIFFGGKELSEVDFRTQSEKIGYVGQDPEHGIVCDKVWHEFAFGLESLGVKNDEIRLKTAEIASFFGIEDWFYKNTSELSGGQKQILNIASVMVTYPDVLILDEPASRLDPIAAGELYQMLARINAELGTTVIMSTHTGEGVLEQCSKLAVLESGRMKVSASPCEAVKTLYHLGSAVFSDMSAQVRISVELNSDHEPVFSVKDARKILIEKSRMQEVKKLPPKELPASDDVISAKGLHYKYDKSGADVLSGLSLKIYEGKHTAVVGGNGAGKTTFLQLLCGIKKAYRGSLRIKENKKTAMLPQNPQDIFCRDSVYEELSEMTADREEINAAAELFGLCHLLGRHPFDLSGGEQQRAAFAKVFLSGADILLLDEPTKGMDGQYKERLGTVIKTLIKKGKTVVTVSHDLDFCAEYADICAMLFNGKIVAYRETHEFFDKNAIYTTAANRIAKDIAEGAVTSDEVIEAFGGKKRVMHDTPTPETSPRPKYDKKDIKTETRKSKSAGGKYLDFLPLLILVPLTLWIGFEFFHDRRYYFISLLLILEAIIPFFFNMEREKPSARKLVLLSVFCAAAVAGRAAFFMIPQFSALGAVVIIAGICFGARYGFLVGAAAMFLSNMFAGQGSWTPYQMAAMGLVGLAAGALKPFIEGKALPAAGGLLIFLIYGPIMNISSVIMAQPSPTGEMFLSALLLGMPFDLIHAASTVIFLVLAGKFMIKKTRRVIMKYDFDGCF